MPSMGEPERLLRRADGALMLWTAETASRMKSKLPVCFLISSALREITTSSAPRLPARAGHPNPFSHCLSLKSSWFELESRQFSVSSANRSVRLVLVEEERPLRRQPADHRIDE